MIYYAIGDIHGEITKLIELHGKILESHESRYPDKEYTLVHLGDYIDRGTGRYEVVELLIKMEQKGDINVINLKGNHEQMMSDACKGVDQYAPNVWGKYGGKETIKSYERNGFDAPPESHIEWMENLPSYHWDKDDNLIFVHAGIDPEFFPDDGEETHLWTRSDKFLKSKHWKNPILEKTIIVHGHTPTKSSRPDIDGDYRRINVDTGACYGGALTAITLAGRLEPKFISV